MAFSIDASDPLVVFGALAALIFLGFAGNLIFSRLRFNDTLILILVGVMVGPVLRLVDPEPMVALSGIIGPLALILILFDGGLALKFRELAQGLGSAAILGLLSFIGTLVIVGGITALALDVPFTTGMILGAILGGTSALVVLPSLKHMDVEPKTGTTLGLESALTDVLVVVVSFTLIAIVAAGVAPMEDGNETINATGVTFDAQGITSKLLITFSMSIFMGLAAGLAWLVMYPGLREKPFGYMLTLGFMFFVYVFVEWILQDVSSGGGPLAVLAFGIILGNNQSLGAMGRRVGDDFGTGMKRFQGEISFLVRTFFFVFLGIIVDLDLLKDLFILSISIIILGGMLLARYLAVAATTRRIVPRGDDLVLLVMMPRGLAAAVLAAAPLAAGIPDTEPFIALAFLLLVWTNLLSTVGAMVLERGGGDSSPRRDAGGRYQRAGGSTGKPSGSGTRSKKSTSTRKKAASGSTTSTRKKAASSGKTATSGPARGGAQSGRSVAAKNAARKRGATQAALEAMGDKL